MKQRAVRLKRADATAQLPALGERDEARTMLGQPKCTFVCRVWHAECACNGGARYR
jgi:hypothetical protein